MISSTKLTLLGSGTCVPRLDRSACAVLVETGAAKILMDLGPGTIRRMMEYGVSIFDLTHIFLSHFHPDHSSELVPLIFSTKYTDRQQRRQQLTVLGGLGLKKFYKGLQVAYGNHIVLPESRMAMQEIDILNGETLKFKDFTLTARPTNHRPESLAYRIVDTKDRVIVYSGDTDECENLIGLADHADIFICDAAMPDQLKVPGHLTPSMAGHIAQKAQVKRLVLTHLYPQCDEVDIVKQARSKYKGAIFTAEDLMTFHF